MEELTLEITRQCHNQCLYCSSTAMVRPSDPPLALGVIEELIREAVGLGLRSLAISGGEPFLHPHIEHVLSSRWLRSVADVSLYTSGVVLGPRGTPDSLSSSLIDLARNAGVRLIFNIQSRFPEVHDGIVGARGRWALTLSSMEAALDAGLSVECHLVPHAANYASLKTTAEWLIQKGIQKVSFLRLVPQGYAAINRDKVEISSPDTVELGRQLAELKCQADNGTRYRLGVPFGIGTNNVCQAGVTKLIVRWDGTLFPCEAFKECGRPEFVLGKIGQTSLLEALRSAWANDTLKSLRAAALGRDSCPAQLLYVKSS